MNPPDVEPIEMTRATVVDREIQALLDGRPAVLDNALRTEMSSLRDHLGGSLSPVIADEVRDAHLTLMMEAFVPASPTVEMASPATLGNRAKAALSRRVAAATLAFSAAFGGAAYAGVLPAPIQDAASDAASVIGINIPSSDRDDGGSEVSTEGSTAEPKDSLPVPSDSDDKKEDQLPAGHSKPDDPQGVDDRRGASDDRREDDREDADDRDGDRRDDAEDREDDASDSAEDDADDDRDDAEDDRDDERDDAEDRQDDAEDREDDAEDDREDAEDREDDALDDAQDATDDELDDAEDREDDARDDAEDVRDDQLDGAQGSMEEANDD